MSLKSLINALFKLSGSQAMPKTGDYITIGGGATQFTASSDGWLKVYSTTTNITTPWINVSVNNGVGIVLPCNAFLQALTCLIMPVKKGDSITILFNGVTLGAVQLFKLVGGGLKAHIYIMEILVLKWVALIVPSLFMETLSLLWLLKLNAVNVVINACLNTLTATTSRLKRKWLCLTSALKQCRDTTLGLIRLPLLLHNLNKNLL